MTGSLALKVRSVIGIAGMGLLTFNLHGVEFRTKVEGGPILFNDKGFRGQLLWTSDHIYNGVPYVHLHMTDAESVDSLEDLLEVKFHWYKM